METAHYRQRMLAARRWQSAVAREGTRTRTWLPCAVAALCCRSALQPQVKCSAQGKEPLGRAGLGGVLGSSVSAEALSWSLQTPVPMSLGHHVPTYLGHHIPKTLGHHVPTARSERQS